MTLLTALTRASLIPLAVFALAGTAAFQAPATAQTPPGQSNPIGLDLSAAQRAKISDRQAQFQKDLQGLSSDPKMTLAQKRAKYTVLLQAMNQDLLTMLTPTQRTQVLKQQQINTQYNSDVLALQSNRQMTDAQKKARYLQLTQNARNASLALMSPAQRAEALRRSAAAEKLQQEQAPKIAEAKRLSQQLVKSETPAQSEKLRTIALSTGTTIQSVIADKTLSAQTQTAKINALRQDALKRDLALLTPAQRTLYTRIQALITLPAH